MYLTLPLGSTKKPGFVPHPTPQVNQKTGFCNCSFAKRKTKNQEFAVIYGELNVQKREYFSYKEILATRQTVLETYRTYKKGINAALSHKVPKRLRYALENNAFIFSGFKTFYSLNEVGLSLTTDEGNIKPFEQFSTDVERLNNTYNHNYLYAEYNHAVSSSLMAEKWQEFEAGKERYDLQYRTAGDENVREEHQLLDGTTLPVDDPFWDKYLPPNGWNCRCTTVQVRKGKYPLSDSERAIHFGNESTDAVKQRIFRYNPGKTLETFPPKHPYYKTPTPADKKAVEQAVEKMEKEEEEKQQKQKIKEEITEAKSVLEDFIKKTLIPDEKGERYIVKLEVHKKEFEQFYALYPEKEENGN